MKFGVSALIVSAVSAAIDKSRLIPVFPDSDRCTTIIASRKAGTEGPMTSHTADCSNCDFRVNKVPAMDWPEGSKRALYVYKGSYPANVVEDRGATWRIDNLEGSTEQIQLWKEEERDITGYIDQVPHTYALYEAGYGIMNEHGLAMGESTCASWFWAAPTTAGGKAQIEVRELSKIALERTKKAREAIQLMGDLAVQLGYYSADWSDWGGDGSLGEGGETLTVVDKDEAWVFHVTSDDTGTSAIWAAQRVPDGEVAAVANQFIIREVKKNDDNFMYSDNLWSVAERAGLWNPADGPLDFLHTFSPQRMHSPYATRRVWRVFKLLDPSLDINPRTDSFASDYPFSVKPAKGAISKEDMIKMLRDHYEGSEFDLTKGLAAGPYGDPERWDGTASDEMTLPQVMEGSFERAISLFRTSYSFVSVSRKHLPELVSPVLWFSQYQPSSSTYTPFYLAATEPPRPFTRGSLFNYDPSVSFWNFAAAGNYASRWYKHAIVVLRQLQDELESAYVREVHDMDATAAKILTDCEATDGCDMNAAERQVVAMLTEFTHSKGQHTVDSWRNLLPRLITQFHDGYNAQDLDKKEIKMSKLFYAKWWLDSVGYWDLGPNRDPNAIMFAPAPDANTYPNAPAGEGELVYTRASYLSGVVAAALFASALSVTVGFFVAKRFLDGNVRNQYSVINDIL